MVECYIKIVKFLSTDFQKHQLGQLFFTIFVLDPIDSVDLILQHSPGANHAKGER